MKLAQKSELTPQKWSLNTKIYEFLMKRIGSSKNGNIRAFFAKCRESSVRAFRKKTPLSVRRCGGGGAKGGTEKVRSFVTFF